VLHGDDIEALQSMLDEVPPPLEAFDVSALDGYLCGVLLQPVEPTQERWLAHVTDVEGRATPAAFDPRPLQALVRRRFAELKQAIERREWFDPWVFDLDDDAPVAVSVLPWLAGFAAAMEIFPGLMRLQDPRLMEPLALLYLHFDGDDLEDADALLAVIETLEPPADLSEAVQDIVRSLMLIADVVHPGAAPPTPQRPRPAGRRR
jgi:uncharacterized protein